MKKKKIAKQMVAVALGMGLTVGAIPGGFINPTKVEAAYGSWAGNTISVSASKDASVSNSVVDVFKVSIPYSFSTTASLRSSPQIVIYKGSYALGDILPNTPDYTVTLPSSTKSGTGIAYISNYPYLSTTYTAFLLDGDRVYCVGSAPFTLNKTVTDSVAPTITLTPSTTSPASSVSIQYSIDDALSGVNIKKFALGNQAKTYFATGGTQLWGNTMTVTENGTYTFYAKDNAGNEAVKTITISNIVADTTPPTPATFTASTTSPTKGSVLVTINYPGDAVTKQYRVGNGTWTTYTSAVNVTENGTVVYARSADAAGNWSSESSYTVNNIDKVAPMSPLITVRDNKLTITNAVPSEIKKTQYQIGDGAWLDYNGEVTLPVGMYTVRAKSIDQAGNESDPSSYAVQIREEVQGDLQGATQAVEKAELSPSASNVNAAQSLIDALSASSDKTTLQNRLDKVKGDLAKYDTIRSEIASMQDTLNKGTATLQTIQQYKNKVQDLKTDVNGLPDTFDKATLLNQLDDLSKKLALLESVLKTQSDGGLQDVDLGDLQDQIDKLPDGEFKDNLQDKLDQAKDLNNATDLVKQAETSKNQSDVDKAKDAVNKLPDGQVKDDLLDRLDEVQKQIDDAKDLADQVADATSKVVIAEKTKSQSDVDLAKDAVNGLPNGKAKDSLLDRLEKVQKAIDADKELSDKIADAKAKVEKAEQSKSQADLDAARNAVDQLPRGTQKTELDKRLDDLQKLINKTDTAPVSSVDGIKDPTVKSVLSSVESTLAIAEKYKTRTWIVNALDKVDSIPTEIKNNPFYQQVVQDLINRANKLKNDYNSGIADQELQQKVNTATNNVQYYEKYRTAYYKTKAQSAVDALPDGETKQQLQARIDAVVPK